MGSCSAYLWKANSERCSLPESRGVPGLLAAQEILEIYYIEQEIGVLDGPVELAVFCDRNSPLVKSGSTLAVPSNYKRDVGSSA